MPVSPAVYNTALDLSNMVHVIESQSFALGTYSDVYLAELELKGKRYKVVEKVLRGGRINKKGFIQQFKDKLERHAREWQHVKHEHVAEFFGLAFNTGPMPALVLAYYKNGNILEYIEAHANITDDDRLEMVKGVAKGLQHLHSRTPKIVHGDIRCANIMIDNEGQPRLIDFGLIFVIDTTDFTSIQTAGACRWMAPELMNSTKAPDKPATFGTKSDVFAFAMTIMEIYSGDVPFAKDRVDSRVIFRILDKERPALPQYIIERPKIANLVTRCWHHNPSIRPSAEQICAVLQREDLHEPDGWMSRAYNTAMSYWYWE